MSKLGRFGTHFEERLKQAGTMPGDAPLEPTAGQLHNEGSRWWRWTPGGTGLHPKNSWMPIDPTDEDREMYRLQRAVERAEDMASIAEALKKGMEGEVQKAVNDWQKTLKGGGSDTYETGKGWAGTAQASHPIELRVEPDFPRNGYSFALDVLPDMVNDPTLFTVGFISEEELGRRAESVSVYGQWMRAIGLNVALYCVWQNGNHKKVLRAHEALIERGVMVERYEWMDYPDLDSQVARAIASINAE